MPKALFVFINQNNPAGDAIKKFAEEKAVRVEDIKLQTILKNKRHQQAHKCYFYADESGKSRFEVYHFETLALDNPTFTGFIKFFLALINEKWDIEICFATT